MELQILKSTDIDQAIESELTLKAEYTFVSVTNEAQLLEAEAEIKKAKADQKLVVSKIKPLKEAIDNFKAKFLSKEKIEISISAFNSWVKDEKNQHNEYISFEEEIL